MKTRDSNLELYRIIMMLLIVAHHYVINSGLDAVIMNEEMPAYFEGQKSLDDVIGIIENRVNLMLKERE